VVSRERARRSACPVNASLEVFGDRWSLLVVRDLMLKGRHSFGELLAGGEGIATNVLADRLQRLEREGIVERAADPVDARIRRRWAAGAAGARARGRRTR
jgi:DNA-binding HxlR family transcriptional regulator